MIGSITANVKYKNSNDMKSKRIKIEIMMGLAIGIVDTSDDYHSEVTIGILCFLFVIDITPSKKRVNHGKD